MKKLIRKTKLFKAQSAKTNQVARKLYAEICPLIESARGNVAQVVNSRLVMMYWQIGTLIRKNVLGEERADYGKQIVSTLSKQLTQEYGEGFSRPNIFRMIRFAEVFPNGKIVSTLSRQLAWSHVQEVIYLADPLQRDFYVEMCRIERWSVRTLREKMSGMLYERTAISKKPAKIIKQELKLLQKKDILTPDLIFRDPYFLNFLGLKNIYSEKDLETAILREIEAFILELGTNFSFVNRQKRISIDGEDYYIDLLFFHRTLRRLVAIELKLDKFKAGDKGQMELYLRWLEKHEQKPDENTPIGLILCAGKSTEHIELLRLQESGIRVAEYMTELPPRKILEKKLRQAIVLAKERLQQHTTQRTFKLSAKKK